MDEKRRHQRRADDVSLRDITRQLSSIQEDHRITAKMVVEHEAKIDEQRHKIMQMDEAFPVCPTGGNKYEQTRQNIVSWRQRDRDSQADKKSLWIHIRNYTAGMALFVFLLGAWEYLKIAVKK